MLTSECFEALGTHERDMTSVRLDKGGRSSGGDVVALRVWYVEFKRSVGKSAISGRCGWSIGVMSHGCAMSSALTSRTDKRGRRESLSIPRRWASVSDQKPSRVNVSESVSGSGKVRFALRRALLIQMENGWLR